MKKIIALLLISIILFATCRKDEDIDPIQKDENGVFTSLPYQWKKPLHASGKYHSNGYFEQIIYNQNVAIPTTAQNGTQRMTMINSVNGDILWHWNDINPEYSTYLQFFQHYISNNLLLWQIGYMSYCVNLDNGTTEWKIKREKDFEPRLFSCNESCYYTTSYITRTDGYDEHIAYKGDIQTGEIIELLRANYSCEYIGPITEKGWVGGIINIIPTPTNNNLLAITYAEPLPNWVVRSLFGLYNIEAKEWIYERKLMAPPLWNTSVYWPQIYNNKFYATVGNNLVCHDLTTGDQLWKRTFDNDFFFSGFTIAEGKIIANNENGTLYCINPETGNNIWTGEGRGSSSRMIDSYYNGIVYFVGGGDGKLHAVDILNGITVWRLDASKIDSKDAFFQTSPIYVLPGENGKKGKIIVLTAMNAYCFEAYK